MNFFLLFPLFLLSAANAAVHTNNDRHFSFDYDEAKWEVVPDKAGDKKQSGQDVDRAMAQKTLVTVQRKDADDKYHARFSVVTDSLSGFKGSAVEQLVAYRKHALDFLKSQRFHILTTEERKLPLVPETAFEVTANQRDFGLTFRQVVFLHGNQAYLLTAATRTAKFEEYGKELQKVFDSFKFTP